MQLSTDERGFIFSFLRQNSVSPWAGFAAVMLPILAFGGYGLLLGDVIALGIAFVAAVMYLLYWMAASSRDIRLLKGLFEKVLADATSSAPDNQARIQP